jgi:hypothetical protein
MTGGGSFSQGCGTCVGVGGAGGGGGGGKLGGDDAKGCRGYAEAAPARPRRARCRGCASRRADRLVPHHCDQRNGSESIIITCASRRAGSGSHRRAPAGRR